MPKLFCLVLLFVVSPWAGAEMYRCKSLISNIVYEANTPCSQAIELNRTTKWGAWIKSPSEEKLKVSLLSSGAISPDQVEKSIKPGMSGTEVVTTIGTPESINVSIDQRGNRSEQWVYPSVRAYRSHYVYVRNGVVDYIQISK